jgi:hypothetical protein
MKETIFEQNLMDRQLSKKPATKIREGTSLAFADPSESIGKYGRWSEMSNN